MNRKTVLIMLSLAELILTTTKAHGQTPRAEPLPSPKYSIALGGRDACVTPHTHHMARADGGNIEVLTPAPDTMSVSMTGTSAAESYLGCTSTGAQKFHLVQEFEIACSDPAATQVALTLDSTLTGFLRSIRKAGASVHQASVAVFPKSRSDAPLVLEHPPSCASGTQGRLCNQHLPPLQGPPMPLGPYVIVADFVIETTASGVCNAHAVADFSPDTTLPADWVRTRDPFQGVSKKSFGFAVTLNAAAPSTSHPPSAAALPMSAERTASRSNQPLNSESMPSPPRLVR